ncbi:MAG: cobalamin-dependent protein, partial [Prevotella sp.]|nr:cobalamin-dependent protein [Prevotella sp.]
QMIPFLRKISATVPQYVIAFPNAGLPDKDGKYAQTPKMMQKAVWPLVDEHLVNIIGGCCGTDDGHIKEIAKLVQVDDGIFISPRVPNGTASLQTLVKEDEVSKSLLSGGDSEEALTESSALFDAIVKGKAPEAVAAAKEKISAGADPQEIINTEMIKAMSEVGRQFEEGTAFVPQLLMAARAMKAALEILKPLMAGKETISLGRIVIGTVKGDLHDIGKNLVASMLEGCGFEVFNIGIDVTAEKFIEEIKAHDADAVCMSALLTTTMPYMKEVIAAINVAGLRQRVKIMVGGAPLTQEFCDEIGADGYSDNANSAVALAKKLLNK